MMSIFPTTVPSIQYMHIEENEGAVKRIGSISEIDHNELENYEYVVLLKHPDTPNPTEWQFFDIESSSILHSWYGEATEAYREDESGRHLQIREFDDRYEIQLDHYHPKYDNPAKHVKYDWPTDLKIRVGAAAIVGAILLKKRSG